MIIPSSIQIYYFLCAVAGGVIAGLMVDGYRSIRYWCRTRGLLAAISDMLFWILCAIIIFIFFLYTNNGDFRYYTIIGMGLGGLLYFKVLSRAILKGMRWFIYYMAKAIRILWMVLIFPIKAILYMIGFIKSLISALIHKEDQKYKVKKQIKASKKSNQKAGKTKAIKNNKINTKKNISQEK